MNMDMIVAALLMNMGTSVVALLMHECGGPFVRFCMCGAAHEGCTVVHACTVARQQVQSQQ